MIKKRHLPEIARAAARPAATSRRAPGNGRGFVLLYAVMTSTIILAVGVSIISIALKQLSISTLSRESQYAFYAANTGAECALYWDFHGVLKMVAGSPDAAYDRLEVFDNPFLATGREVTDPADMATVKCARTPLMATVSPSGTPSASGVAEGVNDSWQEQSCTGGATVCNETAFTVFLGRDAAGGIDFQGPCARVSVEKVRGSSSGGVFTPSATGPNLETTVASRGYNYCSGDNTRRVERGLRFTY